MTGIYTRASEFWRQALVVTLVVSVVLFVLFYSTAELLAQPSDPLSPFYFNLLVGGQGKNLSRCLFIVLGFAWAGWRAVQGVRREEGRSTALSSQL
jgi:F0F1-type ATP synthase assembly protein I